MGSPSNRGAGHVSSDGQSSCAVDLLKSLGRKARSRLEEERRKRHEIIRLDPAATGVTLASAKSGSGPTKLVRRRPSGKTVSQKRKRRRSSTTSTNAPPVHDKDVDRWMPTIAHLPGPTKENRSRLVQLHGLPCGATSTDIRRFFTGLSPQRVLLLPSYRHGFFPSLDASESQPRKKGGPRVKRYAPDLRILVQFESAPTASLATDRSGEVMPLASDRNGATTSTAQQDMDETSHATGAAVAVSQLLKPVSRHLLKHMVIDVKPSFPIHQTLEEIEARLDPAINDILWESAKHMLQMRSSENKSARDKRTAVLFQTVKEPQNLSELGQLIQHRDGLKEMHEELRYQLPFPTAETLDPALAADPIVGLTTGASACLEIEIKRLDDQILRARRWKLGFNKCLETGL